MTVRRRPSRPSIRTAARAGLAAAILAPTLAAGCRPSGGPAAARPAAKPPASPGPPPAIPVTFTDITREAGIRWTHFSGARGKKYMPEIETPGCAFFDYNGDGRPDILLLNGADWPERTANRSPLRTALYRNDGGGRFTDVTPGSGLDIEMHTMGVAPADFDNDGDQDLYISCVLGPGRLFRNDGGGRFTDIARQAGVQHGGRWGSGLAWLDYDRDGRLDLVVGSYCKWTPKTDIHCSVYKGLKAYCTPNVYDGETVRLYRNLGGGRFQDVSDAAGVVNHPGKTWGVIALDHNDDGWPDFALANDMEPNCLFENQKNGTFKEVGILAGIALGENGNAKAGMGIDAADIDGSGRPSILISNFTGEGLSLFVNQGGGQFLESSHSWDVADESLLRMGWGLFFFDFDLDGLTDALVGNGHLYDNVNEFQPDVTYKEAPLLYRNVGARFEEVAARCGADLTRPLVCRGAAYADIDGDGDLDVLLMENSGPVRLLRNDGGNAHNWVRVRTVGTRSARDGIGAKLTAEVAGRTQTRWIASGSSFLSASEMTATFGLGSARQIDRLTIVWPSGLREEHTGIAAGTVLDAREGGGRPLAPAGG